MAPIKTRMPPVTVEYTKRGQRVTKHFPDAYVGRQFYVKQAKAGNSPKVVGAKTMSEVTTSVAESQAVETVTAPVESQTAAAPVKKVQKKKVTTKKAVPATAKKGSAKKSAGATATKKASAKSATLPPAVKKSAKKSSTAPVTKPAAAVKAGLTDQQSKILSVMYGHKGDGLTRAQLKAKTGIDKGFSRLLGAVTKDGFGVTGDAGLEPQGYVKSRVPMEGGRALTYVLTAKGRKAVEAARKAAK